MLKLLAQKHELWIKMVLGMGASKDVAEDIVQSMYLRIDKYVKDDKNLFWLIIVAVKMAFTNIQVG